MPLRFTFAVQGEVQVDRALSRYGDALKNRIPAFQEMADVFWQWEREQFASQGAIGSGGWAPLSGDYAVWKNKHFPGKPLLQLTGALMNSLTGGSGKIERITNTSLTVGTDVAWARFHQTGTGKMPMRQPIQLNDANKTAWMKILQRHASNAAKEAGVA